MTNFFANFRPTQNEQSPATHVALPETGLPQPLGNNRSLTEENRRLEEEMKKQGFADAKAHRAHTSGLVASLEALFETYKHDSTEKWKAGERERVQVQGQIRELDMTNEVLAAKLKRRQETEGKRISELREKITLLRHSIDRITEEKLDVSPVNWLLRLILWPIFLLLTACLYVFYVNTSYRAFFPVNKFNGDLSELEKILNSSGIFDPEMLDLSVKAVYPLLFPVIFLAFAFGLHQLQELKTSGMIRKALGIGIMILCVALFDGLIAAKIHQNIHSLREMLGQPVSLWYHSTDFWIVIFSGFITALLWGWILYGILAEHSHRNPVRIRERKQAQYRLQLHQAEETLRNAEAVIEAETNTIYDEMAKNRISKVNLETSLFEEKTLIHYNNKLRLCLENFYTGWLTYVNAINEPAEPHETAFKAFLHNHFNSVTPTPLFGHIYPN